MAKKTNSMKEVMEVMEVKEVNYSITGKDFSTNFSLDIEEQKVAKDTEKVYSVIYDYDVMWDDDGELVPDAATLLADYITMLVDLYCGENFSEDENYNFTIAQYCIAYLNMTNDEERKEIGLEVVIKEPLDPYSKRKFREVCEGILENIAIYDRCEYRRGMAKKVWSVLFDSSTSISSFSDEEIKEAKEFMENAYNSYIVNRADGAPNEGFYQWFASLRKSQAEKGSVEEESIYSTVSA